jgi:Ca-activated chloride channel homolog
MVWFRNFSVTEIVLILLFVALYVLFILRAVKIGRMLHSPASNIFIKTILRTLAFAFMIIAFLGPSFGDSKKEIKSVGKDIMICVDLSKSMDAFDIQPTRLEKVKFEMKRIVDAFSSDRLGVIIFGSEAFMQCPLTFDQNALNLFIETMNTNLVPSSGTDFGPPLRMAQSKFKNDEAEAKQKSKVIVLISDGEDFGEETEEVAQDVEDDDIRLFTLGIGTKAGSPINAARGYKTDKEGKPVITKLNDEPLRKLAARAGGQYFELSDAKNEVAKLIHTINDIEGEVRESRYVDVAANRYYYFLIFGLVLLCLDVLINVKTMKSLFALSLILIIAIDPGKIGKVNSAKAEAKKAFVEGDYKTASEKYKYLTDSLGVIEDEVMMNLAHSYFNLNDTANALASYQKILSTPNKMLKSNAYQQLGVLNNRQNRLEEALANFKEALKTDPTNEDARYNYEMVKKKLEEKKKQEQQDQNKDKKDEQNKDQEKKENKDQKQDEKKGDNKNKQDQEKKEQEKKEQEKKEQQQKEQAEKDKKEKEQKEQQEKEAKENQEKKDPKDKKDNFNPEKMKEMKVTEEKAKMILEAMKNQEVQYLQQNKRKATKPKDKGKPDW